MTKCRKTTLKPILNSPPPHPKVVIIRCPTIICYLINSQVNYLLFNIFWEHKIEGEKNESDNTPFIISKIQKLDCQFGTHYKQKQGSSKRTHLQGTRKKAVQLVLRYTPSPFIQISVYPRRKLLICLGDG